MQENRGLPLEISLDEAKAALDRGGVRLIDCREKDEFAICKIPGAELIPLSVFGFEAEPKLPDRAAQILVYCHHGMRSLRCAEYLTKRGYAGVRSIAGGIDAWSLKIDPSVPRY